MLGSRRQPIEPLGLPPQLQAGFDGQMRGFSSTDISPHSVVPVPEIAHTSADWLRVSEQSQTCLSMKLSKAAETQRMSHRGFQSLCHIRVRTVQLPPTSL